MFAPPKLRVRIYDIDWILASPGPLDNSNLRRVPVLRIYGDSSAGLKTCVHVHQVYPYFYVEYPGKLDADSGERTQSTIPSCDIVSFRGHLSVRVFAAKLHHSLNKAISFSLKHRPNARHQYVRAVLLVKGVHFYGFHASYSPFLKIYFADPGIVSRCVTLLQCGTVMGTKFRVFESHISYPLQFMCDFALYGCAWIDMDEVWQRESKSTVLTQAGEGLMHSEKLLYKVSPYFRQTRMPLEVDVSSPNILNRHQVVARSMHHELNIPGAPLPPEPLVLSVRELWEDERRRRIARGLHPSPEVPVDPSASSRGEGGSWVSEVEYWDHIKRRIEGEDRHTPLPKLTARWERSVMTTFESIEALWDPAYKTWKPHPRDLTEVEVDEMGTFDSSRDISADDLDIDRDHDEAEASDVDEDLLATQAVTQLITETEDPERQARAQDDEMLPDVAPEGEDDIYDLEHTSQTSSTQNTPRRDKTAQAVHGSSLKRRAATSVPTTPSRSNTGRDATSLSPSQLQAVQESLQTTDSPQTLARITPRHLSYVQSPLSAQTLTR
jgi:DNA polymerase zeta